MTPPGSGNRISFAIILCLVGLLALVVGTAALSRPTGPVSFQDPYPPSEPTPDYAALTETPWPYDPGVTPTTGNNTAVPTVIQPTATFAGPTATPTNTTTAQPDLRLTEESELGESQGTPAASATPGPSITPVFTQTNTPTITATPEPVDRPVGWMDWGFFALGFALPVLAGCGFVLYWLDRRPDLFSR